MFHPSSGLRYQVPTDTLQPTTTEVALKDMRKDNPELQYLASDDWHPTHTRYLR